MMSGVNPSRFSPSQIRDRTGRRQRQIVENADAGQLAAAALGQKHDIVAGLLQMPRQMQVLPRGNIDGRTESSFAEGTAKGGGDFYGGSGGERVNPPPGSSRPRLGVGAPFREYGCSSPRAGRQRNQRRGRAVRYVPAPRSLPKRTSPDKRRRTGWRDAARVVPRNPSRAGGGRACRITARPEPTAFRRRAGESP